MEGHGPGAAQAALSSVSDPIVARADGSPAAIIAGVADDIEFRTTHIIRGEDSPGNTAVQIELFEVMGGGLHTPRFAHLPALGDSPSSSGRPFGSLSLRSLRGDGLEPRAIAACLAGDKADDPPEMDQLAATFELSSMAACRFDAARLLQLNRRALSDLDFAAVADRLPGGATEAFWLAVRGHLDLLKEARGWWDVVAGSIVPPIMDGGSGDADRGRGDAAAGALGRHGVGELDIGAGAGHRVAGRRAAARFAAGADRRGQRARPARAAAADRPGARGEPVWVLPSRRRQPIASAQQVSRARLSAQYPALPDAGTPPPPPEPTSGRASRKPCSMSAPIAIAMSNCAAVSIPSTITTFPATCASATTAPTKSGPRVLPPAISRKLRSSFTTSAGSRSR